MQNLFFLIALIFCIPTFSQKYSKGYMVLTNGDTLIGDLSFNHKKNNLKNILFKGREGESMKYNPKGVRAFSANSQDYISRFVKFETSSDNLQSLSQSSRFQFDSAQVFLQKIAIGKYDLYKMYARGKPLYYLMIDDRLELLLHKKYNTYSADYEFYDVYQAAESVRYRGQLASYLEDCKQVHRLIVESEYTEQDLVEIVELSIVCYEQ